MPTGLSGRARTLKPSATVATAMRTAELRRQGVDIVGLSVGEPDFPTPAHVKEAAAAALAEDFTHYTPAPGIPELREAIAEKSRTENGIECGPGNVLVTPTKMALFMAAQALIEPGDEVVLTDPSFVSYAPIVEFCGGKVVWTRLEAHNDFSVQAEAVQALVSDRTKMVWLCSPSNPTGHVDDPEEVRAIAELAVDHGFWVLSDEIYEKLQFEGAPFSPASVAPENVVTLNGLSKSHAMTGWRAGWAVAPATLYPAMEAIQSQSLTCTPSITQKAMVAAVTGPQGPVDQMREVFETRSKVMIEALDAVEGLETVRPKGAFYAFPRYDLDMPSTEVALRLLEDHHVAVVPGGAFGPSGEGHLRISFGDEPDVLREGVRRLAAGLEALRARTPA